MSTTIVPFFVDLSGEYEISFQQTASGNCGGAGVQINGPAGPVGGGFWPGEDPSPRVFRAILLTGWSYEIVFHQEGQTTAECSQRYDQVGASDSNTWAIRNEPAATWPPAAAAS